MKKLVMGIAFLISVSAIFSGCNGSSNTARNTNNVVLQTAATGTDHTIKIKTRKYSQYEKGVKSDMQVRVFSCLAGAHNTFEQMEKASTDIVKCTVQDVSFATCDGSPYTVVKALVDDSVKGDLKAGDLITVCINDGFMTLQEEVEAFDDAHRFPGLTKSEREKIIVEKRSHDLPYPKNGESYVYFLEKLTSGKFKGAYIPSGSNFSVYRYSEESGQYERYVTEDYTEARPYNKFTYNNSFKNKIKTLMKK